MNKNAAEKSSCRADLRWISELNCAINAPQGHQFSNYILNAFQCSEEFLRDLIKFYWFQ